MKRHIASALHLLAVKIDRLASRIDADAPHFRQLPFIPTQQYKNSLRRLDDDWRTR